MLLRRFFGKKRYIANIALKVGLPSIPNCCFKRKDTLMNNGSGWLSCAGETKARISRLRVLSSFADEKLRILVESHAEAVEKHNYSGSFRDWAYFIENLKGG